MDDITKFLNNISYKFPKGYPDMNNEQDILMLESILTEMLEEDIEIIGEVSLSPTQLEKEYPSRSELSTKYKDRGERFLEKITNSEEFTLNDGTTITIDPTKSQKGIELLKSRSYKGLGGRNKLFTDVDGKEYSLSNFKKTKEFGSGSGQGGGATNTAIAESSQCLFNALAYKVKGGSITEDDITDENLSKAYSFCDVTNSLDEMKAFSQDKSWLNTFIVSANLLVNKFTGGNYQFHRGSKFVESIYKAYKVGAKQQSISMQSDKWNPADVWLVDTSILNHQFPTDLEELNAELLDFFTEGTLVGVSLKKTGESAKMTYVNVDKQDLVEHKITQIDAKITNKGGQILYESGKIYFRTYNFATNFAGEILGKTAAHGKVGMGPINDILRQNGLNPLTPSKEVKSSFDSKDEKIYDELYRNYIVVEGDIDKDEFMSTMEGKNIDYLVSKYHSLQLLSLLKSSPDSKSNEVLSDMLRYASSSSKVSSVFAKIS